MKLKFKSWYQCVQQDKFDCFNTMNEYLEESGKAVSESVKHDITEHLNHKTHLKNIFHHTIMTIIG
jgi:hypothetical protein